MKRKIIGIFILLFLVCLSSCTNEEKHTHSFSSDWSFDVMEHWHQCDCGEKSDVVEHSWDQGTITTNPQCTTNGEKKFTCTICGQIKKSVVTATGHTYSEEYNKDENYHWNSCSCGEKTNIAEHEWDGGVVVSEATETTTGLKEYTCTVCGRTKEVILPVLVPEMSGDDPYGDDIY